MVLPVHPFSGRGDMTRRERPVESLKRARSSSFREGLGRQSGPEEEGRSWYRECGSGSPSNPLVWGIRGGPRDERATQSVRKRTRTMGLQEGLPTPEGLQLRRGGVTRSPRIRDGTVLFPWQVGLSIWFYLLVYGVVTPRGGERPPWMNIEQYYPPKNQRRVMSPL